MYMYRNHKLRDWWGDEISSQFGVVNGVKQGAVSSSLLFAVHIDGLLMTQPNMGHVHSVVLLTF